MKIKNIRDLKININWTTALAFCLIFGLSLLGLRLIHQKFIQKQHEYSNQQTIAAAKLYKSNLSEKLSIIANSTIFIDFLRSGERTRQRLYPQFLLQLSALKSKSIIGMELLNKQNGSIFNYGTASDAFVVLDLCYLNQTLDSEMGVCEYTWKLYFDSHKLLNELLRNNSALRRCENCSSFNLSGNQTFGSFPVNHANGMYVKVKITEDKDYFFYIYLIFMTISLLIFSCWSWYRLSNILNNYIADPIKYLADCLKANEVIEDKNVIQEIQYLVGEINKWKARVNKAKEDEHAGKLGKIAAQLAHDVGSPLMVLGMLIKNASNLPENCKLMMQQAIQRISDISNNFLIQYKSKMITRSKVTTERISSILYEIINEKRHQYCLNTVQINLCIAERAVDATASINSSDFQRIISNLVNNAVESLADSQDAKVDVNLDRVDDYLHIDVNDNGCGIASELLEVIFTGVSIGKTNGNGMGLSHAKATIEEWGGFLSICSEKNIGTQVTIKLPIIFNI